MRRLRDFILLRVSVRARLTILYGTMFLLAGGILIAIFYTIFRNHYPGSQALEAMLASPGKRGALTFPSGARLTIPDVDVLRRLDQRRARVLDSLTTQCLIALAVVAVAALGAGWIMAGRVLRPVRRITDTARRVADRNLHERISLHGPDDEFKELADTFDAMLERLDASFEGQRQFVANASHEFRTPLATTRTLLEVATASANIPAELRPLIDTLLSTTAHSELIIDGLLTLARSESQAIQRVLVDMSDIAADAVEQTAHEAATARVRVDATPDPAITIGDPVLLERLALNLVRNGIQHNHPDGWVSVTTSAADGEIELVVANSGPVVRPQQLSMLFEPFRRLDGSRLANNRGVGLGLSIVRSVVHAHGGDLTVTSREAGGLIITISFPAAEPADPSVLATHFAISRRIITDTKFAKRRDSVLHR